MKNKQVIKPVWDLYIFEKSGRATKEIVMGKKSGIMFFLALFLSFTACAQQRANDPSDFNIEDHGTWIEITGYRGTSKIVVMPTHINDKSVTVIGDSAFQDNQLTSVTIPNGITKIGIMSFQNNQLTSITIPNSVTEIGIGAFAGNQLTSVTIPNSVTELGVRAFANNPLTKFSLASGNTAYMIKDSFLLSKDTTRLLMYIGNEKDVTIPNGVNKIDTSAFSGKQLTSVTIPSSVESINYTMFNYSQLASITFSGDLNLVNMFTQTPDGESFINLYRAFSGAGIYTQSSGEWRRFY